MPAGLRTVGWHFPLLISTHVILGLKFANPLAYKEIISPKPIECLHLETEIQVDNSRSLALLKAISLWSF